MKSIIKAWPANTEWKWMAICDQHSNVVTANTRAEVAKIMTAEFCDCCSGDCTPFCQNCNNN